MTFLVDTHTVLWSLLLPRKLSRVVNGLMTDPQNTFMVSALTLWEISLKYSLGKLDLMSINPEKLYEAVVEAGFKISTLDGEVAAGYWKLPKSEHTDPFDRMLVWQAIGKGWPLISKDKGLDAYKNNGLTRVW